MDSNVVLHAKDAELHREVFDAIETFVPVESDDIKVRLAMQTIKRVKQKKRRTRAGF